MASRYQSEFPSDFTVPAFLVESKDWIDISWHNDVCPSFQPASDSETEPTLRIWVNHPEPEQRECGGEQFLVEVFDHQILQHKIDVNLFKSDDEDAFRKFLETVCPVILRAIREVKRDVRNGTVPADVKDFSALHSHVDANYYGGAFEKPFDGSDEAHAFWNKVQQAVDKWIKVGGLKENKS